MWFTHFTCTAKTLLLKINPLRKLAGNSGGSTAYNLLV